MELHQVFQWTALPVILAGSAVIVYNKVINHAALQTLDVLAIGMVTLVGFELVLRALRGYVTAHTGARLETAIGSDVVRHLVHLPYGCFHAMPSSAVMERVRQLDPLRQFLTGHLPLTIVDLGFVGLFLAALLVLAPTLGLVTLLAMPPFVLLSWWAQRKGITLLGTENNSTLTIPSIKTRRAETTVEIPSGGALAMAGMIGEQTKQQINGIPGLMQLPVLGALFKSRDYINKQTELVVIVSPYVVRAVAQKELSRPDGPNR